MSETIEIQTLSSILSNISKRLSALESRNLYTKVPWKLPKLTTTERNALNAVNGDIIYNTTLNRVEAYENGSWVDL